MGDLHRALAKRSGAHDGSSFVILQRRGNDLGRRRGVAVNEHHQRLVGKHIARGVFRGLIRALRSDAHDSAAFDEVA